MIDEETDVSTRTTARNLEPISKAGLKDGAADGQSAAFQSSFDEGYYEGFNFGFKYGCYDAERNKNSDTTHEEVNDKGKVNCQLCLGATTPDKSVLEISRVQQEKNIEFLHSKKSDIVF